MILDNEEPHELGQVIFGMAWLSEATANARFMNEMLDPPTEQLRALCRLSIGVEREQQIFDEAARKETIFEVCEYLHAYNEIVPEPYPKMRACFCGADPAHRPLQVKNMQMWFGLAKMLAGTLANCVHTHYCPTPEQVRLLHAGLLYLFGCHPIPDNRATPEDVFAGVAFCAGNLCCDQSGFTKKRKTEQ